MFENIYLVIKSNKIVVILNIIDYLLLNMFIEFLELLFFIYIYNDL